MAIELAVGVSFPVSVDGDLASNYVFASSDTSVLTVNAAGSALAVAPGLANVSVTRKSDGYVQRLPFKVIGEVDFVVTVNGQVYGG